MRQQAAVLSALLALAAVPALAQSPRGEAKADVAGKGVKIEYGRPSLRGRDILAMAEVGRPWRLGADEATTLDTKADLAFDSIAVKKGHYILKATKLAEDRWVLNVHEPSNDDRGSAGTKVADIPLNTSKLPESVEMLTLELKGDGSKGSFEMKWGTTSLQAAFTGK